MNLVHARDVKSFNMTFTGAFTNPQVITFNYYWKDKNSVALWAKPWGPFPQNSANVISSATPYPKDLPIKQLHTIFFGINDNGANGGASMEIFPGGIQMNLPNPPFVFSGIGVLGSTTVAENTLMLV